MDISAFGIGKAVCDASYQLGLHSLSQSACFQPNHTGLLVTLSLMAVISGLAFRYWQVSAP